ncbi:MAG: glycosyltransferase family 39 protein [Verrucomicrobiia bacterium]
MFDHLTRDGNAPLHPFTLRIWMSVVGDGDWRAQVFSVFCYFGACWVLFRWARWCGGRMAGLFALACACTSAVWLDTAIQVRPYSMLLLVFSLALYSWQRVLFDPSSGKKHVVVFSLALLCSLYTHPWAVFGAAAFFVVSLGAMLWPWPRISRRRVAAVFVALIVAGLGWLPQFAIQLRQSGENLAPWSGSASWSSLLVVLNDNLFSIQGLAFLALVDFLSHGLRRLIRPCPTEGPHPYPPLRLVVTVSTAVWVVCVLLCAIGASQLTACWASRYAVLVTPGLFFLIALQLETMWRARGFLPFGLARCLIVLGLVLALAMTVYRLHRGWYQKSNARDVAAYVRERWRPGDLVVVSSFAYSPSVVHYLPPEVHVMTYPSGDRVAITSWVGIGTRILDERSLLDFTSRVESILRPSGRVWLVDPFKATVLGYGVAIGWVMPPSGTRLFNYTEALRAIQIERWLSARAKRVAVFRPEEETRVREIFTATLFVVEPEPSRSSAAPVAVGRSTVP